MVYAESTDVTRSAVQAMWGRVGPSLIKLTAEFSGNVAKLQFVVEEGMGTAERDLYEDAATEFLSYFNNDSDLDIEIVETPQGTASIQAAPLQEEVFLRDQSLFPRY